MAGLIHRELRQRTATRFAALLGMRRDSGGRNSAESLGSNRGRPRVVRVFCGGRVPRFGSACSLAFSGVLRARWAWLRGCCPRGWVVRGCRAGLWSACSLVWARELAAWLPSASVGRSKGVAPCFGQHDHFRRRGDDGCAVVVRASIGRSSNVGPLFRQRAHGDVAFLMLLRPSVYDGLSPRRVAAANVVCMAADFELRHPSTAAPGSGRSGKTVSAIPRWRLPGDVGVRFVEERSDQLLG